MTWRKWLVRTLAILIVLLAAGAYYVYTRYTDPETVRRMVLAALTERLPGAEVQLESARLRLFGGVELRDLRLLRRDDPGAAPFAVFPEVVLQPDKEELGRGHLTLHRIELRQAKLTLVHRADGSWNLSGLAVNEGGQAALPIIDLQNGVLVLIDQTVRHAQPVELHAVNLTAVPRAGAVVHVQATAVCRLLGPLALQGDLNLESGELNFAAQAEQIALGTPLLHQVLDAFPALADPQLDLRNPQTVLEGRAALRGEVHYHPAGVQPWSYAFDAKVEGGRVLHPRLPFPVEEISLAAGCDGSKVTLERASARFNGASLQASGGLNSLSATADFTLDGRLDGFALRPDLYSRLPKGLQRLCAAYSPNGLLGATCKLERRDSRVRLAYVIQPRGMSVLFEDFPYPADGVTGTLAYREDGGQPVMQLNLSGRANGRPVRLTGQVFGEGLSPANDLKPGFSLDLTGEGLPIDGKTFAALAPYPDALATVREFKPAGLVDFQAQFRRQPGKAPFERLPVEQKYVFNLHQASVCYAAFPYPVEQVEGVLELWLPSESWRFSEFRGRHKGGVFTGEGRSSRLAAGGRHTSLLLRGSNALLDAEMEAALDADMREAWRLFRPGGRVDFTAKIESLGQAKPDLDLQVTAKNCSLYPACFPYRLQNLTGSVRYAKDRVTIKDLRARHESVAVTLDDGEVHLRPGRGYRTELRQLRAEPLPVDAAFLEALPSLVRSVFVTLKPDRPIRLVLNDLVLDDPGNKGPASYAWDGHVAFAATNLHCGIELGGVTGLVAVWGSHDGRKLDAKGNLQLDEATIARQTLHDIKSQIRITDDTVILPGIQAALHGGQVYGPIRVDFGDTVQYQFDLTASRIDLEQFARQTLGRSGQVHGKADARLTLSGRGDDLRSLRGNGWINVSEGRLYDLPLVLDLLTFLSGRLPKGAAFQDAHAKFTIENERLRVSQLDLLGDAISLKGLGDLRVDGTDLNLEMYGLLWGRTLPLLPPLIDKIPPTVSKQLMKIRVLGKMDDVKLKTEPVPILVEPVKELLKMMSARRRAEEGPADHRSP